MSRRAITRNLTSKCAVSFLFLGCFVVAFSVQGEFGLPTEYNQQRRKLRKLEAQGVSYNRDVPIIWLGGYPGSGIPLVRAMLDAHPDVRCANETELIPKFLDVHKKIMASPLEVVRLYEAKITNSILNDALAAFILSILAPGENGKRLCFTDPEALVTKHINKLMELFPNSKILVLVRDGRGSCQSSRSKLLSMKSKGIRIKNVADRISYRKCLTEWNKAMDHIFSTCLQQGMGICLPVTYEHLVINSNSTMRHVLRFLNVPWSEWVLHNANTTDKGAMFSLQRELSTDQVNKPINTDALTKWVGDIPDDVLRDMDEIAPMLERLGYDPHANPPDYNKMRLNLPRPSPKPQKNDETRGSPFARKNRGAS